MMQQYRTAAALVVALAAAGAWASAEVGLPVQEQVADAIARLRSPSPEGRREAARDLRELRLDAVPAMPILVEALDSPEVEVRRGVVAALSNIGPPAAPAVPRLVEMFEAEADSNFRIRIARSLGAIGPDARSAVPALIGALEDESPHTRAAAAQALGHISADPELAAPPLLRLLSDGEERVRRAASTALGRLGTAVLPHLRPALGDEDEEVRYRAAEALVVVGRPAGRWLPHLLRDPNPRVRESAARAAGQGREPLAWSAASELIRALDDPDPAVRHWTIMAAARTARNQRVRDALLAVLELSDEPSFELVLALSRLPEGEIAVLHRPLLGHDSPRVRAQVARALGLSSGRAEQTLPSLRQAMEDADEQVRRRAAEAVARLEDRERCRLERLAAEPAPRPGSALAEQLERRQPVEKVRLIDPQVEPYPGWEDDRRLLAHQMEPLGPRTPFASGHAIDAANRVFCRIEFVGMTAEEVMAAIGEPTRRPRLPEIQDTSWTYVWSAGMGGVGYVLEFREGKVAKVSSYSLH